MNVEYLVKMANQIAAFYVAESASDAPKTIAAHLARFWDPRMRTALTKHNELGGAGLNDATRKAVALLSKNP